MMNDTAKVLAEVGLEFSFKPDKSAYICIHERGGNGFSVGDGSVCPGEGGALLFSGS